MSKNRIKSRQTTEGFRKQLYTEANGRCVYCGKQVLLETMSVDHIIPVYLGGTNSVLNKLCCCRRCNLEKGEMPPKEYVNSLSFLHRMQLRHRLAVLKTFCAFPAVKAKTLFEEVPVDDRYLQKKPLMRKNYDVNLFRVNIHVNVAVQKKGKTALPNK